MAAVKLLRNDDEALDPGDPTLRIRGSILVDGHERGTWEQHRDGSWTARLKHTSLTAASEMELIALIKSASGNALA